MVLPTAKTATHKKYSRVRTKRPHVICNRKSACTM